MIVFGLYLLLTADAGSTSSFSNLWSHGGFFPNGFEGLFYMLAFLMFAFGGIELIGMAAAEAKDPEKTIPKAINQVVFRILIFYVGSLTILLSLVPWNQLDLGGLDKSPFVMIFSQLGIGWAAHLLNFIILTAALSVYNSGMYANSRMLFGLAEQGNAPKFLRKINARGIPYAAILTSAFVTAICVVLNYVFPEKAFKLLMNLVVAAIVINWMMLALTHLKFKQKIQILNKVTRFPAIAYPITNYICVIFMLCILLIMWMTPDMRIAVILIPFWLACLAIAYRVKLKKTS